MFCKDFKNNIDKYLDSDNIGLIDKRKSNKA